jgi:hypothetical protein
MPDKDTPKPRSEKPKTAKRRATGKAPRVTVTLLPSDDPRVLADHERLWDFLCGLVLDPKDDDTATK